MEWILTSAYVLYPSGVPRETEKDKEFADFDIFDDPNTPYSTFNFQYSNLAFKQLHDLMEFNTLNNIDVRCHLSSLKKKNQTNKQTKKTLPVRFFHSL